ncbi:MAG: roadblock/LC7 domain-containing protein [Proteobacteria bacterium]|nr:roadblock/LC7 domain-containing protein [Pseudomonadota bacterium]
MVFEKILQDIVQGVEGGRAGLIIGRDGIALETFIRPDSDGGMDIQALGVELVTLTGEIGRVTQALGSESFEELSLVLLGNIVVMRMITPEYFLVVVLGREGNFGKVRYLMRRELPRLRQEL